jgi:hypothetical protein
LEKNCAPISRRLKDAGDPSQRSIGGGRFLLDLSQSLARAGVHRRFQGIASLRLHRVQIDIDHRPRHGVVIEQDLGFEAAFPEVAFADVFLEISESRLSQSSSG